MPKEIGDFISKFFSDYGSLLLMIALIIVIGVVMFRSKKKREKEATEMSEKLRPGVKIQTIGGIRGSIVSIEESIVIISMIPNKSTIAIAKEAIAAIGESEEVEPISQ